MEPVMCCSGTRTINLLTNLFFFSFFAKQDCNGAQRAGISSWLFEATKRLVGSGGAAPYMTALPILISVLSHFGADKAPGWVGLLWYSCHILLHKVHCDQGSSFFFFFSSFSSSSSFCSTSFSLSLSLSLIKRGRSRHRLELSASLKRGWASCMKLIIQNGFSQTEKNSCLHYLNASPFPAPLIGSLITGRGARWLIRTRLLVK